MLALMDCPIKTVPGENFVLGNEKPSDARCIDFQTELINMFLDEIFFRVMAPMSVNYSVHKRSVPYLGHSLFNQTLWQINGVVYGDNDCFVAAFYQSSSNKAGRPPSKVYVVRISALFDILCILLIKISTVC